VHIHQKERAVNATDVNPVGNPELPAVLRAVTGVECGVVLTAGIALFGWPFLAKDLWAWAIAPFHSRYVGGIYLAAFIPLLWMTVRNRWSPGRVVLWMIFVFTSLIMLVMLMASARFAWDRAPTWVFWGLYLVLPVHSAFFLWLLYRVRGWTPAVAGTLTARERMVCQFIALAVGSYGLAMLLVPVLAARFWPWPVDAFHGRLYAASYLTPAFGLWLVQRRGSCEEFKCVGVTALGMGFIAIIGVALTSAQLPPARQVDFMSLGAQAFVALHAAFAAAGLWVMTRRPRAD
jgi:hypothetical protein